MEGAWFENECGGDFVYLIPTLHSHRSIVLSIYEKVGTANRLSNSGPSGLV